MMVTEEEAATKDCCGHDMCGKWVQIKELDGKPLAPDECGNPQRRVCAGSACMAWRWAGDSLLPTKEDGKGYCGLVGRPT